MVLETTSVPGSISRRLVVPSTACATVEAALAAHLPSVRYQVTAVGAQAPGRRGCVSVGAEYRLNTGGRPLRSEPGELSAGLLASLQPLRGGESIVVQWLLTPAGPVQPAQLADKTSRGINFSFGAARLDSAEAVTAMKAKRSSPLPSAVGRIVVQAAARDRALAVLRQVESPWHGSRAPGVHLQRRLVSSNAVVKRVQRRSVPVAAFPMTLNVNEASSLIGFPIDLSSMPGLTLGTCRLYRLLLSYRRMARCSELAPIRRHPVGRSVSGPMRAPGTSGSAGRQALASRRFLLAWLLPTSTPATAWSCSIPRAT